MTDKPRPLQIPLPGGSGRAPTGAVQFQDDWPGLFIRGDTAIIMAHAIRTLEASLRDTADVVVASQLMKLARLAEIVERDVKL